MSRPQKKGLDYFPLDTNLDESVEMIEAEFGMKGFGLWIKILQKIYGDKGYYIEWNKDQSLLFAKRANLKGSLVDEIVSRLIKRGLFNESLFNSFGVFTSKAIQKRYLDACTRRKSVEIISEFVLVDTNNYSNVVNVDINECSVGVNVDINSQSKVKESKVKRERARARDPVGDNDAYVDTPDSLDEVIAYCKSAALPEDRGKLFYQYYQDRGWCFPSGNQMLPVKNWRQKLEHDLNRGFHEKRNKYKSANGRAFKGSKAENKGSSRYAGSDI